MNQTALNRLYSHKQQQVLRYYHNNADFSILINDGAVRSGKTVVNNEIFIAELLRIRDHAKKHGIVDPIYILAGADLGAIKRNVLNPITQRYGFEFKLDKFNMFKLFDVIVWCTGHDDLGRLKPITGMTAYGAYINEGSLANRDVFDEITKRCSADIDFVAHVIVDTNPGGPQHWLKTEYLDRELESDGRIKRFHWTLHDNPFLSPAYKTNLIKTTPSGVIFHRKIDGLWAVAEGLVYQDITEENYIDELPNISRYFVGMDWGYEHYGSLTLWGESAADDNVYVLVKEITARHKGIDFWKQKAQWVLDNYGYGIPFYCDSARPDLIAEFRNVKCWCPPVDKSIEKGIECVAERKKANTLLIYRQGIDMYDKQQAEYVWDEKSGLPVKENDDVMDSERYAVYNHDKRKGRKK